MKLSAAAQVGIFTLVGLMVLASMIIWKGNLLLMAEGYQLIGSFPNIEGLSIGGEVRYRGFTVGRINRVDPGPRDIKVYAIIKSGIKIPADSTLRVGFDGIVGSKYLEIKPGISEEVYAAGDMLPGITTAGIVDFVDIGAQNLKETKAILENFRKFVEDPQLQVAVSNAILNVEKITESTENLADELRQTNQGIMNITNDPEFQTSVKGIAKETNKTLTNANSFFDNMGRVNIKPNAEVAYGSTVNQVRGNLDFNLTEANYLRLGLGEGATRSPAMQDIYLAQSLSEQVDLKLGIMNTQIGGGLDMHFNPVWTLSGDIYDVSNPKPNVPKIRLTSYNHMANYVDLMLQADDMFNNARNYSFGLRVSGNK